jgi:phosphopantothenoylcysteine synthetase/decarboxylase
MKVLLTSGGTKVPIDDVRHIGNMSSGTFGSKIGTKILEDGNSLYFLTSKEGKTPLKINEDLNGKNADYCILDVVKKMLEIKTYSKRYYEIPYSSFQEYEKWLELYTKEAKVDVIILAAAVSDYLTKPTSGKIRSSSDLNIQLEPAPKLISKIRKEWGFTGILVGFKLLVGATKQELIAASHKSIRDNGCDFVVANDLNDIKRGDHKILLVTPTKIYEHPKELAVGEILAEINRIQKEKGSMDA